MTERAKVSQDWSSRLPDATIRIFTDFDGTVVPEDVGELLFRHYCGDEKFEDIRQRWDAGELTAQEAYGQLCRTIPRLTRGDLEEYCASFMIDPAFPRFAEWCAREGYPLLILSDGLDQYIDILLSRAGVQVPFLSNILELGDASPAMRFPHADPRCTALGNCKSNHVALRSQDDDLIIYIGDGSSDFEAAQYADLVFARGSLETWCQEQNITFRRFYNFTTVRDVLSHLISQNRLRRRKRAEVLRRQLWARG